MTLASLAPAESANGDPIEVARNLHRAGYHVAAVASIRVMLEAVLLNACDEIGIPEKVRRDGQGVARLSHIISRFHQPPSESLIVDTRAAGLRLGDIMHGGTFEPDEVAGLIETGLSLRSRWRIALDCGRVRTGRIAKVEAAN